MRSAGVARGLGEAGRQELEGQLGQVTELGSLTAPCPHRLPPASEGMEYPVPQVTWYKNGQSLKEEKNRKSSSLPLEAMLVALYGTALHFYCF